jgi:regulator of sigma E protease
MILTAVVFFIILSILVFIHEFGHFIVARLFGVRVEEFGFGLPPRILGKKIKQTEYSINWLPIGGFVRLAGEDDPDEQSAKGYKRSEYFWAKSKKQRTAILLAGVTMNFFLAVAITTYLLTLGVYEAAGQVHIESVVPGSPAALAGITKNDIIREVRYTSGGVTQSRTIRVTGDLISTVRKNPGQKVTFIVKRGSTETPVSLVPRKTFPANEGPTGIVISDLELRRYSPAEAPVAALKVNLTRARDMFAGMWSLVTRIARLQGVGDDVAGPIGIAQVTGQAVKFGWKAVLEFMSILSLNLAVLNVLPIPALDGGRVLFVFIEKLLGKRLKPAFERSTHQIGMIILLALVVLISLNDILRLARGG